MKQRKARFEEEGQEKAEIDLIANLKKFDIGSAQALLMAKQRTIAQNKKNKELAKISEQEMMLVEQ